MTTAIYPGSFDPITNGHLDVLKRACSLFNHVIIAVAINNDKNSLIPIKERIELIKSSVEGIENVEVDSFSGLTVQYAKARGAKVLIRGLRAVSDFEYEMQMAQMNKVLDDKLETIFLMPRVEYNFLSSRTVKEVSLCGGDISSLVPEVVKNYLVRIKEE